jgi:hypothetical protein
MASAALAPLKALSFVGRTLGFKPEPGKEKKWRDPDSNWRHHDFQGRGSGAGKVRKVLQIDGS